MNGDANPTKEENGDAQNDEDESEGPVEAEAGEEEE